MNVLFSGGDNLWLAIIGSKAVAVYLLENCLEYVRGHRILRGFPTMYVEILYLKIKIRRQLINIHEVTDFHSGFLTYFSALTSNTRWTTKLMNIYVCVGNI